MEKKTTGVEVVNSFITPKGISRTLEVEVENNDVDIAFTVKSPKGESSYHYINLNRREALTLVFYLIRVLLPHKLLVNKWKKEEKEDKKD